MFVVFSFLVFWNYLRRVFTMVLLGHLFLPIISCNFCVKRMTGTSFCWTSPPTTWVRTLTKRLPHPFCFTTLSLLYHITHHHHYHYHIDLDSVIWLEEFLQRQSIPMLVVSHDREFLDKVCNKIVDVEDGVTISYTGRQRKSGFHFFASSMWFSFKYDPPVRLSEFLPDLIITLFTF